MQIRALINISEETGTDSAFGYQIQGLLVHVNREN
jgi:hypothetical protein